MSVYLVKENLKFLFSCCHSVGGLPIHLILSNVLCLMDWSHMYNIVNKYELILVLNLQTVQYFCLCTIQVFFCMKPLLGMRNRIFCEPTPVYVCEYNY